MAIEFIKPIRSEYASVHDFIYAYAQALKEYNRKCMRVIDKESTRKGTVHFESDKRGTKTGIERDRYRTDSLHDFLQDRPHLLEKYKKFGIQGLL